ncbi:hypothetical protein [Glaciibacter superstes]|uniref:hypothetical protein n=1 Tax=Glaciibacter superstes TaxID=501023 RepID=UPI0003B57B5F|nr:hypothetical protein [Glaciibacter superstes]
MSREFAGISREFAGTSRDFAGMSGIVVTAASVTDVGRKRQVNEDSVLAQASDLGLHIVLTRRAGGGAHGLSAGLPDWRGQRGECASRNWYTSV